MNSSSPFDESGRNAYGWGPCKPNPDLTGKGIFIALCVSVCLTLALSGIAWASALSMQQFKIRGRTAMTQNGRIEDPMPFGWKERLKRRSEDQVHAHRPAIHHFLDEILKSLVTSQLATVLALCVATFHTYYPTLREEKDPNWDIAVWTTSAYFFSAQAGSVVRTTGSNWARLSFPFTYFIAGIMVTIMTASNALDASSLENGLLPQLRITTPREIGRDTSAVASNTSFHAAVYTIGSELRAHEYRFSLLKLRLATFDLILFGGATIFSFVVVCLRRSADYGPGCTLNGPEDDTLSFGQIFAIVMLSSFVLTALSFLANNVCERIKTQIHRSASAPRMARSKTL
ncbi:Hypothetical protein D9617_8g049510 [Elsinoe fawcettii]|nr:Hypothetical protein D9617_8g049510 [Elsinoe fawcettii]